MSYAIDPESIQAYRNLVMVYSGDLWREKDPGKRAVLAAYLADAATTLSRLETEEAHKLKVASSLQNPEN